MQKHNVMQLTKEWFDLRKGRPTASEAHRLLTPSTLKPSKQATRYMHRLIAEAVTGQIVEVETRAYALDRGIELEEQAVQFFELQTGLTTEPGGFVTTDDGKIGASPDRWVSDGTTLEVKAPFPSTQVGYLLDGGLPVDHLLQVQFQMYVCETPWAWFCSYCPALPALLLRVLPDPLIQDALATVLAEFCADLDDAKGRLAEMRGRDHA